MWLEISDRAKASLPMLCSFPEAAVMYDHTLGAYNNRNVFSLFWKPEV